MKKKLNLYKGVRLLLLFLTFYYKNIVLKIHLICNNKLLKLLSLSFNFLSSHIIFFFLSPPPFLSCYHHSSEPPALTNKNTIAKIPYNKLLIPIQSKFINLLNFLKECIPLQYQLPGLVFGFPNYA